MAKVEVIFGKGFKGLVEKRAQELIESGNREGKLDDRSFGELMVCVDIKPPSVLYSGKIGDHFIYVGGEQQ